MTINQAPIDELTKISACLEEIVKDPTLLSSKDEEYQKFF